MWLRFVFLVCSNYDYGGRVCEMQAFLGASALQSVHVLFDKYIYLIYIHSKSSAHSGIVTSHHTTQYNLLLSWEIFFTASAALGCKPVGQWWDPWLVMLIFFMLWKILMPWLLFGSPIQSFYTDSYTVICLWKLFMPRQLYLWTTPWL